MANPSQGDDTRRPPGSKRKHTALFDPSKFPKAKKPTTINITSEINPAPIVPGQNTYPPARRPQIYPRKQGLTFADLPGQELADLLSNPKPPGKRQQTAMGNEQSRNVERKRQRLTMVLKRPVSPDGFQLPETPPPRLTEPADHFDHTVGAEEEEHLYDEEPTQPAEHTVTVKEESPDDETPTHPFNQNVGAEEEDNIADDEGGWYSADNATSIVSGGSKDGVITYEDVATSDEEVLRDDEQDAQPKLSAKAKGKQPARSKGKKRKRKDPCLSSDTSTWYSSDDSRGFEKRAKNGGKRNLYKRHEYTPPPEGEEEDMGREIPKSFATMSEADKILFEWWEVEKKSWAAIARKVNELTGGHETGADMALRYEALRRYLHHKERYFVDESVLLSYQAVDEKMFLRYDVKAYEPQYVTLRWNLIREEYWDREHISKKPAELRAHYEKLTGDVGAYAPSDEEEYDPAEDDDESDLDFEDDGEPVDMDAETEEAIRLYNEAARARYMDANMCRDA